MRKTGAAALMLVALLVAGAALAGQAAARDAVPFKGADAGSWGIGSHSCPAGAVPVWVQTTGTATQLGHYAYASTECANLGAGTYAGSFEITAANGDVVAGTYSGTFTVDGQGTIHYEQINAIAGGTGRFADAIGSVHVSGLAYGDGDDTQTMSGTISSPGA